MPGETAHRPLDSQRAGYIADALNALPASCTVATRIEAVPAVSYKGVRLIRADGTLIEAHIFPDSLKNYRVMIYTNRNGTIRLHGKYSDHAYRFITALEREATPGHSH